MNDLTKEAIQRQQKDRKIGLRAYTANAAYSAGRSAAQSNIDQSFGRPKYGNDYLEPDRPLTGRAINYLTKWDDGSKCDHIKDHAAFSFKYMMLGIEESRTGINLDKINRVSDDYLKISDEVEQEIGE